MPEQQNQFYPFALQAAAAHQARVRELTAQAAEARDAEADARRALTQMQQAAEQQRAETASRLESLQRAADGASRAADGEVAALRGQLREEKERRWANSVCIHQAKHVLFGLPCGARRNAYKGTHGACGGCLGLLGYCLPFVL